ncbi:alpha/beta fold hydrolase [Salegentibacter sp. F14]
MKKVLFFGFFVLNVFLLSAQEFSWEQVAKFPFPSGLTASSEKKAIAWAVNEQGKRNIYYAHAPAFIPKKITEYKEDDGQEISSLQFSEDGKFLVYVRGGEHGGWNADNPVNPTHNIKMPKVEIFKIYLETKKVALVGQGDNPVISSKNKLVFTKDGEVWITDLESSKEAKRLFEAKGSASQLEFNPEGEKLLFVSNRGGYSLIGVYEESKEHLKWISPSFHRDRNPRWSPDGNKIVFVRTPGGKGSAKPLLEQRHNPWEIRIADLALGESRKIWKASETLTGSLPTVDGGVNLHWAANNQIIFTSYDSGWPHLYAIDARSGQIRMLTKGDFHPEHITLSPEKSSLAFSANYGPEKEDLDRRHIGRVDIKSGETQWLTSGKGIEAYPVFYDEKKLAFLSATAKRPHLVAILEGGEIKVLNKEIIPEDFPEQDLITPKQVSFEAADGTRVYGQLFQKDESSKNPGIVFIHGGPQRQMLLGWSYMDYYSNTYALNQYLAERGFAVLSVNYRLGIGYGHSFHKPDKAYYKGASEYQDIKAAGEYLAGLPSVDADRIGVYGGSYGGYLTALALGKDPDLFKVGVDIHGVHNFENRYALPEGYEIAPDYEKAKKIAWESSPLAYLDDWKSPVLFIHGDDDRNVDINHTVDFIRRFEEKNLKYDFLMIPDDTHHWMRYSNMVKVGKATASFLEKHLKE